MSNSRIVLDMKVRNNAVSAENRAFQAKILPNQTYKGRELYERLGDFLGIGSDGFRAERMVTGIESFIRHELEAGNRLDFGLVTFYPRLSGALPRRDSDPSEAGLYIRPAVMARGPLMGSLEKHLVARNPIAGDSDLTISNVWNETLQEYDVITPGAVLNIAGTNLSVDLDSPDEGVWLEKPIKRRSQKHESVARAEILKVSPTSIRCKFTDVVPARQYNIVVATRGAKGKEYKVRYLRRMVSFA